MRDDERSVINRIVLLLLKNSMYADRETSQQGGHIPVPWSLRDMKPGLRSFGQIKHSDL
jgi:hypothetical protein